MSINVAAIPSPFIHATIKRRKNTWYTIASGNWSDPNIWMSNSHRRYAYPSFVLGQAVLIPSISYPTANDDVFIEHNVALDISQSSLSSIVVNNLYISNGSTLSMGGSGIARGIVVVGDIQCNGTLDMSNSAPTIVLYGVNNYINNFISGSGSTVNYFRIGDQPIMDLPYRNLTVSNSGKKYLVNNLTIAGNLATNYSSSTGSTAATSCIFECSTYNLTVNGATSEQGGIISKTGSGSLLFIGLFSTSASNLFQGVDLSGNPTVELRGGLTAQGGSNITWNTGTSTWSATTTSQTWTFNSATFNFSAPVSIVGAIDLTVVGNGVMQLTQPINHTVSGRTTTNKGIIYFSSVSSIPSFTTGTFDITSFANTVGYTMGANLTLPYTNYYSLLVGGTGVKTPSATLSLPGALTINSGGSLQVAAFDLTVTGATTNSGTLSKSSSGAILFIGATTFNVNSILDLTGNPSVEVRGGLNVGQNITYNGSVTVTLTTNNQTITAVTSNSLFAYNLLISGAITATVASVNSFIVTGIINGNNVASTLDNRITGTASMQYQNTQQPMLIGILQTNAAANTFIYNKIGDQNVTGGTYRTLTLAGSGIKTLTGNVVVATLYTLTPPATLDTNGFSRT